MVNKLRLDPRWVRLNIASVERELQYRRTATRFWSERTLNQRPRVGTRALTPGARRVSS
jgi:hypothetical protein